MKNLRKFLSILLCLSISTYTLPGLAFTTVNNDDGYKVELSSTEMNAAIGASGSVDVNLADYTKKGATATAVFANRTTLGVNYTVDVVDQNGNVVENLATGFLNSATAELVTGIPTDPEAKQIQARIWQPGVPGLEAKDSSWAP